MPVAYVIAEIEITNPEGYKEYTAMVPATIQQHGGRFLVRGGKTQVLEGIFSIWVMASNSRLIRTS
jgi:uncharacterized protein (DUF1330 family)